MKRKLRKFLNFTAYAFRQAQDGRIIFLTLILVVSQIHAVSFWDEYAANKYYKEQDYSLAAKKTEKLLLQDSNGFEVIMNMGKILYKQEKFEEAVNYFSKLKKIKTLSKNKKEDVFFNLASAQAQQEKWSDALEAFEKVVEINSENKRAKKNIEIIKKIMAQKANDQEKQQDKDQKDQQDKDEKSGNDKQKSKTGNSDDDKKNSEKQKNEQERKKDGAQSKNQSAQQKPNGKGSDKSNNSNQDKQGDAGKDSLSDKQHDKQNSSSNSNKQNKQHSAKKQAQDELDEKLNWQEKRYLEAVQKSDERANAHMMKLRAQSLKGSGADNEHNW